MDRWRRLPWKLRYVYGARVAWRLRRLAIELTHLHCHVEFKGPVRLGANFSLDIPDEGSFIVGRGVDFRRGFHCEISGSGRVSIGDGAIFTSNALIQCTTSIDIGDRAVFAQNVMIADGNHSFGDPDRHLFNQGYNFRPIEIGRDALILSKCTLVAGVGTGAVVGANSVVTRPIPPYCLALGAPARVVKYFGPPDQRPPELDLDPAG